MTDAAAAPTSPAAERRDDLQRAGVVFAVALALAFGYVAVNRWSLARATPLPLVHDEFSYLLGADTFLHGRLANPASPVWQSFQSFHVLAQPTYASKFPPGNGVMLAIGTLLGSPILGVWLAYALGCALLTWAARPFVGRTWALAGGLVAALWLAPSYWVNSYWGGALPFAAGALLLGATRRLWDAPSPWLGLGLGTALAVLANTRPFEGLIVSAPLVGALAWRVWRSGRPRDYLGTVLPAATVLAVTFAAMLLLNQAVTGSPFTMAYSVYQKQYGWSPLFVFSTPQPRPLAPFNDLKNFQGWEYAAYDTQRSWAGFRDALAGKIGILRAFYFPSGLWLPLLGLPLVWADRWVRGLAVLTVGLLAMLMSIVWMHPHYVAPLVAPVVVVYLASARRLAQIGDGPYRAGRLLAVLLAAGWFWMGAEWYSTALAVSDPYLRPPWAKVRADVQDWLSHEAPGKHVVLLRYSLRHNFHDEWVYNGADLEGPAVLFARDMGPEQNAKLVAHYRDRKFWVAYVDSRRSPIKVGPYKGD